MCVTQLAVDPGHTLTVVNAVGAPGGASGDSQKDGNAPCDARAAVRMAQATQLALTVRSLVGDVIVGGRLFHGRCAEQRCCVMNKHRCTNIHTRVQPSHDTTSHQHGDVARRPPLGPAAHWVDSRHPPGCLRPLGRYHSGGCPRPAVRNHCSGFQANAAMQPAAAARRARRGCARWDGVLSSPWSSRSNSVMCTGHKQHSVLTMVTNLLGTAMLALGIACIVRCVCLCTKNHDCAYNAQTVGGGFAAGQWVGDNHCRLRHPHHLWYHLYRLFGGGVTDALVDVQARGQRARGLRGMEYNVYVYQCDPQTQNTTRQLDVLLSGNVAQQNSSV